MTTATRPSLTKFVSTAIAIMVGTSVLAGTMITDAQAGKRERWIAGGIAAGIVGTAIVAGAARRHREEEYANSRWERHVDRCYRAYRSYDEETDTYIDFNGNERRCRK